MNAPSVMITKPDSRRHQLVLEHLRAHRIEPVISPAVFLDGNPESHPCYDHQRRLTQLGYGLTKGEVGCFLAHRKAWEKVVELGSDSLVMEDDARMEPNLPAHLALLAESIKGRDLAIRLYSFRHPPGKVWRRLTEQIAVIRPLVAGSSAVAYVLTPQCARHLLAASEVFWLAVDEYMDDEFAHGCAILQAKPELIRHEDDGSSLIGAREKPPIRPLAKLRREGLRLIRNVRQRCWRELILWRLGLRFRRTV
jgi:glycosyl transferase family 25